MILTVHRYNSHHVSIRREALALTSTKVTIRFIIYFEIGMNGVGGPEQQAQTTTTNGDRLPTRERGYRSAN